MQTQTVRIAVTKKGNVIDKVGRASICQPKTNFSGGSIKWYQDKLRKESR
jgi:hypothetical protein